ncbi:MAG: tRNA guanosine(34) transglycosylase Tgt [Candidatus Zixiibacteriota bacterium]
MTRRVSGVDHFQVEATSGRARAGTLNLNGKAVPTPVFMPVGTAGTVKALPPRDLEALGAKMVLGNTYHLYLRPGLDIIRQAGGLHRFAAWNGAILTDSGGYQVFSLQELRKIEAAGVRFRSHLDGSEHLFTPEGVFDLQKGYGSDIAMVLDVCTPYPADEEQARTDLAVTLEWARRSRVHKPPVSESDSTYLFGIVQGSVYANLRQESAIELTQIGFDGYAIGGLSVGEPKDAMMEMADLTAGILPEDHPRYLMGVGTPVDIVRAVGMGIDMFDCVLPTRNGRNGSAFTANGPLQIKAARFSEDFGPLDPECDCEVCRTYSRAYIRHLFNAGEISAMMLTTRHNLHFYLSLMRRIRQAIVAQEYSAFARDFLSRYGDDDPLAT